MHCCAQSSRLTRCAWIQRKLEALAEENQRLRKLLGEEVATPPLQPAEMACTVSLLELVNSS